MLTPNSPSGSAITMAVLADKAQHAPLTMAEQNIVMTNSAKIYASTFGPMPADMHLRAIQLPENVK